MGIVFKNGGPYRRIEVPVIDLANIEVEGIQIIRFGDDPLKWFNMEFQNPEWIHLHANSEGTMNLVLLEGHHVRVTVDDDAKVSLKTEKDNASFFILHGANYNQFFIEATKSVIKDKPEVLTINIGSNVVTLQIAVVDKATLASLDLT